MSRIYHAHAMCTYGTFVEQRERIVIRTTFPSFIVVDPGTYEDNEEKLLGGMNYCMELVESCDALAFSRIRGKVTAGVGMEVEHALALGRPVFEIVDGRLRPVFEAPSYVSREETRQLYDEWERENL